LLLTHPLCMRSLRHPRFTFFFSFILRRPPGSPLFPYTTLFRSVDGAGVRSGTAFAHRGAAVRIVLGRAVTERQLADDWVVVHERSEEHTSELQSPDHLVCRLLLEKKKKKNNLNYINRYRYYIKQ